MKKIASTFTFKSSIFAIILLVLAFTFASCETKINFLTSSVVPAATGYVTVKTDDNKNYAIKVSLSNLAESTRLTPAKSTYVVWVSGENGNAQNIGQMQTLKLKASLQTVSAFKPSKIFVTAEDAGNVQFPGETILTTATF